MKKIILALCAAMSFPASLAAQELPVYRFDLDGGVCDTEFGYAEFGVEGMAWVDYGGDFINDGSYYVTDFKNKNGLAIYYVSKTDYPFKTVFIVNPKTGRFTSETGYLKNPNLMNKEGMVDVAVMHPCN